MNVHQERSGSITAVVLQPRLDDTVTATIAELAWRDGAIEALRPTTSTPSLLVTPGFIDLHVHWPQGHVRGQFSGQLLPWLRECIWPAEQEFDDTALANARAREFAQVLARAGTTTALTFGPPFLDACLSAGLQHFDYDGPALMEVNAPPPMCSPVEATLAAIADVPVERGSDRGFGRRNIVVSPRFAPNVTASGLATCGRFAREHGLLVQSHVSENTDEVAWVRQLFPEAEDYLDVYDRAGLLGPGTVLAHGVHLSDRELERLAESETIIAHCPTSNEALQSGRAPIERYEAAGTPWVLATDVGAGPLVSMVDVMAAFVRVHGANGVHVTAEQALARATAHPGAFLARHDDRHRGLGTLQPGSPADFCVFAVPSGCNPDDSAETLLTSLFRADRATLEALPQRVVKGGKDAAIVAR